MGGGGSEITESILQKCNEVLWENNEMKPVINKKGNPKGQSKGS